MSTRTYGLCVDGSTHPDPKHAVLDGSSRFGCYPPFYVFDIEIQDYIAGPLPTREAGERVLAIIQRCGAHL